MSVQCRHIMRSSLILMQIRTIGKPVTPAPRIVHAVHANLIHRALLFSSQKRTEQTDRQTDGRARSVMQPTRTSA